MVVVGDVDLKHVLGLLQESYAEHGPSVLPVEDVRPQA